MKKTILLLSLVTILFASCSDDDNKPYNVNPYSEHFTFLQFDNDVISSKGGSMCFYLDKLEGNINNFSISAYNRKSRENTSLNITQIRNVSISSSVKSIGLDIPALEVGEYNLIIRHKESGKEFRENFTVRENIDLIMRHYDIYNQVYLHLANYASYTMHFAGRKIIAHIYQRDNNGSFSLPNTVTFQNKATGQKFSVKYNKQQLGVIDTFTIPENITDGYYYVSAEDGAVRAYSKKAVFISKKITPKLNKVKQEKSEDGKHITLTLEGDNFSFYPNIKLLPSSLIIEQICPFIYFTLKNGDKILMNATDFSSETSLDDMKKVIVYNIPLEDSKWSKRPITNEKDNYFDGYVYIDNVLGESNKLPLRIDYDKKR